MTIEWNKDDCIRAFNDLVSEYPDKPITRDFFRKNSECPEYSYLKHFGTFAEFKSQAGYKLSSGQSKFLNNMARHASKDNLREFNKEKIGYEGKYIRKDSRRYQSIVTISDTHDINFDPFTKRVYLDTLKRVQPEVIVFGGDIFDLPEFSKYYNDPRQYRILDRIKVVHDWFTEIREILPDSEMNFICGNHCHRLFKHLSESSPHMISLLSDLHGFTISKLLGLDKFQMNFISRDDLGVFTESDLKKEVGKNYLVKFDSVLFHHFPEGKRFGYPGVNGHHHSHKVDTLHNLNHGVYEWHQIGAGHIRRASYCEAQRWSNGFMISHHDTHNKSTVFEYVDTTPDFTVVGGKMYYKNEDEKYTV